MKMRCGICHHNCNLAEGQLGVCRARRNRGGQIICENYGRITSIALDPIEKKPLYRFKPGGRILSVGSYGCNMRCLNCQNCEISMADPDEDGGMVLWNEITPEELVGRAVELTPHGNVGLAYTYNEPFIGYEFVMDCARLIRENGLSNVAVTNGCVCEQPLLEILPYFDAMNIDLKSFSPDFYRRMGGDLDTVRNTIKIAAKRCHVEVTTLIIPGENDTDEEMEEIASWLSGVDMDITLHVTRFFPAWKMTDRPPTPVDRVYGLARVAKRHLKNVFVGNC
ncbi:MAG: AmmeMemoRadiSam system radical SAM enzyme [Clostridiales bacterium]|jgi:pyruvate formate lyase activating enzyme|nr:AmmeMemoRadiSam system radical SAM enzyme [Clostridiales bacterium]